MIYLRRSATNILTRLRPVSSSYSRAMSSALPPSSIPLFDTVASYREWRHKARDEKKSVGYVATMGALHDGHLSLGAYGSSHHTRSAPHCAYTAVKRSLAENDLTVLSIFVNPAQFAPHEDLATYPRTLPRDLELLSALSVPGPDGSARTPSAVFVPTVNEMYPSGISQNTQEQKGTFVEVMGYGHQMEGRTRPTFFRGVATVVTKLFNAIEASNLRRGARNRYTFANGSD